MLQTMNTKEDIKKKCYPEGHPVAYCTGIDEGVDKSFKEFAKRIELYKRYRYWSNYKKLKKEEIEVWNKFKEHVKEYYKLKKFTRFTLLYGAVQDLYNPWLFEYYLGDMLK